MALDAPAQLLVVCGPSAAGKSTLVDNLVKSFPDDFAYSVSHTSRAARAGEVDGRDYHFVPRAAIEAARAEGLFIETAEVHGELYGTSVKAVQDVCGLGKVCVLILDIEGAKNAASETTKTVLGHGTRVKLVLVVPPSSEELERRLRARGTETPEAMSLRLWNAVMEMRFWNMLDFWDLKLRNDDLETALCEFRAFALKSYDTVWLPREERYA